MKRKFTVLCKQANGSHRRSANLSKATAMKVPFRMFKVTTVTTTTMPSMMAIKEMTTTTTDLLLEVKDEGGVEAVAMRKQGEVLRQAEVRMRTAVVACRLDHLIALHDHRPTMTITTETTIAVRRGQAALCAVSE